MTSPHGGIAEPSGTERRAEFAAAYQDHSDVVYRLASRTCGTHLAADITQEVFLRLWARPDSFDATRGSLRTFLLALSHNAGVDVVRSESARRAREALPAGEGSSWADAGAHLLEDERTRRIVAAIDRLPHEQRDAIITAFYGEITYREAAVLLNAPEGTIKSRIRAGLTRLRADLTDLVAG